MYKLNDYYLIIEGSINYCMENVDSFQTKWNITAANTQVNLSCTDEYMDIVSRNCRVAGIWEEPNYIQCMYLHVDKSQLMFSIFVTCIINTN